MGRFLLLFYSIDCLLLLLLPRRKVQKLIRPLVPYHSSPEGSDFLILWGPAALGVANVFCGQTVMTGLGHPRRQAAAEHRWLSFYSLCSLFSWSLQLPCPMLWPLAGLKNSRECLKSSQVFSPELLVPGIHGSLFVPLLPQG